MKKLGLLIGGLLLALAQVAQADVKHIGNQELQKLLEQGVPIIDIRRAEEWKQTGIIEKSHLMTFFDKRGRYDLPSWLAKLEKIAGKEEPFILICRTGNRTGTISRALEKQLGYKQVYNVKRGITDWKRHGLPVVPVKK